MQFAHLTDIRLHADRAITQITHLLFERFRGLGMRDVIDDDVRPLLGQLQNDGHADAAIAAGDDGDLAFKTHIFLLGS